MRDHRDDEDCGGADGAEDGGERDGGPADADVERHAERPAQLGLRHAEPDHGELGGREGEEDAEAEEAREERDRARERRADEKRDRDRAGGGHGGRRDERAPVQPAEGRR